MCCNTMNLTWTIDDMLDDLEYPAVQDVTEAFIKAMKEDHKGGSDIERMVTE